MRHCWFVIAWAMFTLAACAPRTEGPSVAPTTRDVIAFPQTWTPTVRSQPPSPTGSLSMDSEAGTPTPTPTATFTPTGTREVTPGATSTVNYSAISCTVTALEGGVELLTAPFFSDNRILPTMEPGYAYQAADIYPTYIRLLRDEQEAGWVDYRLLAVEFEGEDCLEQPYYEGDLTDFDTLCFMRATPVADTYSDRELTEPFMLTVGPEYSYVVVTRLQGAYASCVGHAGPCFYVDADEVEISGSCDDVPFSAEVITEAELWPEPSTEGVEPILTLPVGTRLSVQNESVQAPPPPEAPKDGRWLLVKLPRSFDGQSGWLWSAFIGFR